MSDKVAAASGGIGFFSMLTILFVGLKLGEVGVVATWSWWYVLGPLWMPWAVLLGILCFLGVFALVTALLSK